MDVECLADLSERPIRARETTQACADRVESHAARAHKDVHRLMEEYDRDRRLDTSKKEKMLGCMKFI